MCILIRIDDVDRPLYAPRNAAAYAVIRVKDTVTVLFRFKKAGEASGLTALNDVRAKLKNFDWKQVSVSPIDQIAGGVTEDPPFGSLSFKKQNGSWVHDNSEDYINSAYRPDANPRIPRLSAEEATALMKAANGDANETKQTK